ncbi:GTPase HflX [Chondrinema litorale]|uniref:GTPase HflX n=1 Tax=Chondrinema litorale TaxID=2994555 RepID=UPI00254495B6|nr:GTPase HflX [Chondrinema litorale]UZR92511.1 GTPase HflX [Chondrinema litorale]
MKKEFYYTEEEQPTAVLVALSTDNQSVEKTTEYLDELAFLAETLGVKTLKTFRQKLQKPDPKYFVGKGKLEEITAYVEAYDVDMIIFDDDLSSAHIKNLDNTIKERMIIDRSLLILQIFMKRAQTAQARTQVELAQYQYMLPRLTNLWSHHSRQRGGIGMRGPGETELETDKRIIRDKISLLQKKLEKISKQSAVRRKSRDRMVRVALVGYTNVGKSTIMRTLGKADVFAENKLFATVDSTVRKLTLNNIPFLLTDTVGFIRKLPTTLIESFKSTLDEIVEADLLLHVVDISHDSFEEHMDVVNKTLQEIGAADKPCLLVFNKIDLFQNKEYPPFEEDHPPATLDELKATYLGKNPEAVFISAVNKENFEEFRKILFKKISKLYYEIYPNHLNYSLNQLWLMNGIEVEDEE